MRAILRDQKKSVLSSTSLLLEKPCSNETVTAGPVLPTTSVPDDFIENPALSLEVETESDQVRSGVKRGVKNPFSAIGVRSIKIVNKIQDCQNQAKCSEITDFLPRGRDFQVDLVAFYVPITEEDEGKIHYDNIIKKNCNLQKTYFQC